MLYSLLKSPIIKRAVLIIKMSSKYSKCLNFRVTTKEITMKELNQRE